MTNVYQARVGEPYEKLSKAADGSPQILKLVAVTIDKDGKTVANFDAANSQQDIEQKLEAHGFLVDSWSGRTAKLRASPKSKTIRNMGIGCLGVIVVAIVASVISAVVGQKSSDDDEQTQSDPIGQMELVFAGNYSYDEIRSAVDAAEDASGLPHTPDSDSRIGSALVTIHNSYPSVEEMQVLRCVSGPAAALASSTDPKNKFATAAGVCVTDLSTRK